MKQFSYVLTGSDGLDARLTGILARTAARFKSAVSVQKGAESALLSDARAVLTLGARCGDQLRVIAEGIDEEAAVAAMQQYFVFNL